MRGLTTEDGRPAFAKAAAGRRRVGFTLLELLIVIGIMALLMAMALPALENLSKRGLNAAAPTLMSTLRLARQHAITQRKYVWVVFPDIGTGGGQGGALVYNGSEVEMGLRSYAVIEGDANNKPSQYITEWKYLPQGTYFDSSLLPGGNVLNSFNNAGTANYPFPNSTSASNKVMPAIEFRPNGRAYFWFTINGWTSWRSFQNANIYLMSAVVNVNTGAATIASPVKISLTNTFVKVYAQTGQLEYFGQ